MDLMKWLKPVENAGEFQILAVAVSNSVRVSFGSKLTYLSFLM